MFDLVLAESITKQAMQWVQVVSVSPVPTDGINGLLSAWYLRQSPPSSEVRESTRYECGLRVGLVAYLNGKYDAAIAALQAAGAEKLSQTPTKSFSLEGVGLSLLIITINKKRIVWREDAIQAVSNDRQKTAIKLADLYLFVLRFDKTIDIYNRFLEADPLLGPITPAAKSYAMLQLAWAYSRAPDTLATAKEYLKALYEPSNETMPWAPFGLVRLGAIEFNNGSPEDAMPHFERVLKRYPKCKEAKRALYFYALAACKANKLDIAKAACQRFLDTYPSDIWAGHVREVMERMTTKS